MKSLLTVAAIGVLTLGVAACSSNTANTGTTATTAPKMVYAVHPRDKNRECRLVKHELRNLNRQAPNADRKVAALEKELSDLNCGVK